MKDDILLVKKLHGEFIYLLIRFISAMLLLAFGHKNDEVTKPAVRPRYGFSFCRGAWSGDRLRSEPDSLVYSRAVGGASNSSVVRLHRAPVQHLPSLDVGAAQASCFPV